MKRLIILILITFYVVTAIAAASFVNPVFNFKEADLAQVKALISNGAIVNQTDSVGWTPLMNAAYDCPDEKVTLALIQAGAKVNFSTENKITPLFCSIYNTNPEVTRVLIENGAKVKIKNADGFTPLAVAAIGSDNLRTFQLLVEAGANPKEALHDRKTILMYACQYTGNPDIIRFLLDKKALITDNTEDSFSPLMFACANKETPQPAFILLDAGANPKKASTYSTLMIAAQYSPFPELVQSLLDKKANVNYEYDKLSALLCAAGYNPKLEVLQKIVDAGADLTKVNKQNGFNALMMAAAFNPNPKVMEYLLTKGFDPMGYAREGTYWETSVSKGGGSINVESKQKNILKLNLLMASAIYNPYPQMTEAVLKLGIPINDCTPNGTTALMFAAAYADSVSILNLLIKNGADLNAKDKNGRTALMFAAASMRKPEIIRCLLNAGVDGSLTDNKGKTAYNHYNANDKNFWDMLLEDIAYGSAANVWESNRVYKRKFNAESSKLLEDAQVKKP